MTEALTTGVFGTLILAAIGYLVHRVDRMEDRLSARMDLLSARMDALEQRLVELAERVARIEGRLDEREHHDT